MRNDEIRRAVERMRRDESRPEDLVLCRSDAGDGGWSLHAPGSTDEQIASGDAPPLLTGESEADEHGDWLRPSVEDYTHALRIMAGGA